MSSLTEENDVTGAVGQMRKDCLYMQTFGNFSLEWNEKKIVTGKAKESQFTRLMQIILHQRRDGVEKGLLKQIIFEGREIENENHALRSVIYNARKRLQAAGLPDLAYIQQKKDVYYFTDAVPVVEDTDEMVRLYLEAGEEADQKRKLDLYLQACYLYTGEFLGSQIGMVWVAQEAKKYHDLFCACMEKAVELLREEKDYVGMEELGIFAAQADPLANWETITMEALVAAGRYVETKQFYNDTLELYLGNQGLWPSRELSAMMDQLGGVIEHGYAVLEDIQWELMQGGEMPGGYICSFPVFQGIYHIAQRTMERNGPPVYLMLCTIVNSKGNPMREGDKLEELSQRLEHAICHAVRRNDAVCRYGKGQYLVLLSNTTKESCAAVQKRISQKFMFRRHRAEIHYHVSSVMCPLDEEHL